MASKLICFDLDGVIFKDINFWMELHKAFGTEKKGIILTKKYLHKDYEKLVEEVVCKLWKGKDAALYYKLVDSLKYNKGVNKAIKEIKKKGYKTAIISASSIAAAKRAQNDLGIDYIFANELVIKNGKVSGEFRWTIAEGGNKKAVVLKKLCKKLKVDLKYVVYIGDSDMDAEAFMVAGKSVAFNSSSEKLKEKATYVVESDNLFHVLRYID